MVCRVTVTRRRRKIEPTVSIRNLINDLYIE